MPAASSTAEPKIEGGGVTTAPATFYAVTSGNDVYWRVKAPAEAVGGKLVVHTVDSFNEAATDFNRYRFSPGTYSVEFPSHEGTAVWIRPEPLRANMMLEMRRQGILTVSEVDDNYLSNPRLAVFMRQMGVNRHWQMQHARSMCSADRIVFSTELLRDIYWQHFTSMFRVKRGQTLPEPFVCGNHIPYHDWPQVPERDGPPRVGWMGSPSHVWDVNLAYPAMQHASVNLGLETYMIGYDPSMPHGPHIGHYWGKQSAESRRRVDKWRAVGYTHIPWVEPHKYGRPALPLEIGLCPLVDNAHTRGKSPVKSFEYAVSGAATVAFNTPVYNRTLVHGETALLVDTPEEMAWAVDILAQDEPLRMRLVNNLRQYIYENHGEKQLKAEWGAALAP